MISDKTDRLEAIPAIELGMVERIARVGTCSILKTHAHTVSVEPGGIPSTSLWSLRINFSFHPNKMRKAHQMVGFLYLVELTGASPNPFGEFNLEDIRQLLALKHNLETPT